MKTSTYILPFRAPDVDGAFSLSITKLNAWGPTYMFGFFSLNKPKWNVLITTVINPAQGVQRWKHPKSYSVTNAKKSEGAIKKQQK